MRQIVLAARLVLEQFAIPAAGGGEAARVKIRLRGRPAQAQRVSRGVDGSCSNWANSLSASSNRNAAIALSAWANGGLVAETAAAVCWASAEGTGAAIVANSSSANVSTA